MKRCFFLLILFFGFGFSGRGQEVVVNFDVDTTIWKIQEPLNLWLDFLNTKNDSIGSCFWNSQEIDLRGPKDYFLHKNQLAFGMPDFLNFISYANIRVLSIRKRGDYYKISNSLAFLNEFGKEDLYAIFDVYAGDDQGELKLFNALHVNKERLLEQKKVGCITYYYPKNHVFDMEKAVQQNVFLVDLAASFKVPIVDVEYYFAETNEEIQRIKGFDYLFGDNGENIPSGIAYIPDRMVFTNGAGEYYPHEIIHILLNPHFPNAHFWINEGIATYFGMSRGQKLDWHLEKLYHYLKVHPEIDLGNMLSLRNVDGSTAYQYVLGGFVVQLIFEKEGYEGLKKALNAGVSDVEYYALIEDILGIKRDSINTEFRAKISEKYGD